MKHVRQRHHRRGIFIAETITAIGLIALIGVLLAVAVGRHHRGSDRLAESRAAVNLAEDALTALQAGQAIGQSAPGISVKVEKLDTPASVPGMVWATVQTQVNGRGATITGLVRADALREGAQKQ
jgi:type II secretory pathway pseudopilin PulG